MKRLSRPVAIAGFLVSAALTCSGVLALAGTAAAYVIPDTDGYLSLEISKNPLYEAEMQPGDSRYWQIITHLMDAEEEGELSLEIQADGVLSTDPDGLRMRLDSCTSEWDLTATPEPTCAGIVTNIEDGPLADVDQTIERDLGFIPLDNGPYFLVELSLLPSTPGDLQNQDGTLGFGFTANESEAVIVIPGDEDGDGDVDGDDSGGLARTGVDLFGPLLLAAGLLLGGFILARQRTGTQRTGTQRTGITLEPTHDRQVEA